jgi:hypothetical protein
MDMVRLYDKIRLKNGLIARIVEVLEAGVLYIADVEISIGKYETEHVQYSDIATVFVEHEQPLLARR